MNTPIVFNMHIPQLSKERTIRVWTPSTYESHPDERFPVLYMHDGQNLFSRETAAYGEIWDVHTAVESLMATENFPGVIIVGIDNAPGFERLDEYSAWPCEVEDQLRERGEFEGVIGGGGVGYGKFIVETLKPYIDAHYRTRPDRENTGVAGSSMGGVISLYLGAEYPEVFSKIGAFSTAGWFAVNGLTEHLKALNTTYRSKWYLDVGTEETSSKNVDNFNEIYVQGTLAIEQLLKSVGVSETDIKVVVEEGATHFELAWARRFPEAFKWLYL